MRAARIRTILHQLCGTADIRGMHLVQCATERGRPVLPLVWNTNGCDAGANDRPVAVDYRPPCDVPRVCRPRVFCGTRQYAPGPCKWSGHRRISYEETP